MHVLTVHGHCLSLLLLLLGSSAERTWLWALQALRPRGPGLASQRLVALWVRGASTAVELELLSLLLSPERTYLQFWHVSCRLSDVLQPAGVQISEHQLRAALRC